MAVDDVATRLATLLRDELDIGLADTAVADLASVGDLLDAVRARLSVRVARILAGG